MNPRNSLNMSLSVKVLSQDTVHRIKTAPNQIKHFGSIDEISSVSNVHDYIFHFDWAIFAHL